ncbi:hypothetical protein Ae406Ps2_6131 [Pseudonocardia sp. Ae406_Ps2]|uniref:DoxX family protein n=1 Tax=unclassified Pseudonocardia TaxID=2619320 RepID=UPI00094B77F3|nr:MULTISPECIES: DoxX family protein [unclassified Pseudonocardia]OLL89768.1 hypothetical protein Ae331Ps2_6103c [Pseudonocardia sp. Ae331_Ps2]OLL89771.1 hypothetical protein Ae331Ps2_6106c [Pseudonocardia sp. Ae331_Ps2]OLL89774.1 hypothetical protein Ae331Ps2_6109c [Pseudonocardia sp. Ae331_Ps2]OLL96195.1 hypothetical protein Ae406Ps2_6029 [Pseudonocardia sp. Ae406_Ps2]OLL96230.1 hypothetical protein Ae406Ps2_6066 [Pseudonocardia sp. Ae406_Ps2]
MRPLPPTVALIAHLLARLLIGGVLIAHGAQKATGFNEVVTAFTQMGVPAPAAVAATAMTIELLGGAALIVGFATTIAAVIVVVNMTGAVVLVHSPTTVFVTDGGWELVGVIAAGALLLAATGPGPWAVDTILGTRRHTPPPATWPDPS